MSVLGDRFMWMMVFFDLPTGTKPQRRAATQFRNFLLKDGYFMLQYSVYARICNGDERVTKHRQRLTSRLPEKGSIRLLTITDLQYKRMESLLGTLKLEEETATSKSGAQLSFF